ncbi:MAG: hypothetical protein LBF77_10555 [Spirochaetaceae bacterium]|jgi:hypothetical protein|nr:hypothetical protein [Spirochaetaceae bacterium]
MRKDTINHRLHGQALAAFYRSSLCRKLEDEETKHRRESPAQLYRDRKD